MTPMTVNAYANFGMNEIVFPAAILQPPFFDPHADDAINYGGIGAVIGHEISHHFDDQGAKYDESSEEHTYELQSLMRISYAVFCLQKQQQQHKHYKLTRPNAP